jgi:hypothetical protein
MNQCPGSALRVDGSGDAIEALRVEVCGLGFGVQSLEEREKHIGAAMHHAPETCGLISLYSGPDCVKSLRS